MFKKIAIIAISMVLGNSNLSAQRQKGGLEFNKTSFDKIAHKAPLSSRRSSPLPIKTSLKEYAPPSTKQIGNICVGKALATALTIQEARQRCINDAAKVSALTFSATYLYGISRPEEVQNCEMPSQFETVITAIQSKGILRQQDLPENCPGHKVIANLEAKAFKKSAPVFTTLFNPDSAGNVKRYYTKLALSNNNPVVIGMSGDGAFSRKTGEEPLWKPELAADGIGHAVCIVGYDNTKFGGAFEIINSYGTEWGNQGFAWITYQDFEEYVYYGIEVPEMQQLPPLPSSTPSISVSPSNPEIVKVNKVPPTPPVQPSRPAPKPAQQKILARVSLVHDRDTFKLAQVDMSKLITQFGAKARGRFRPIKVVKPVKAGDACQLLLDNDGGSYVYVFSFDAIQAFNPLFPHSRFANISPYLGAKNDITLPSEDSDIEFENHPGMEYMCLLFSKTELDMEDLKEQFTNANGDFFSRLNAVYGDKLVAPNSEKMQYGLIEADINMNPEQTIVPVIIEFTNIGSESKKAPKR